MTTASLVIVALALMVGGLLGWLIARSEASRLRKAFSALSADAGDAERASRRKLKPRLGLFGRFATSE